MDSGNDSKNEHERPHRRQMQACVYFYAKKFPIWCRKYGKINEESYNAEPILFLMEFLSHVLISHSIFQDIFDPLYHSVSPYDVPDIPEPLGE